MSDIIISNIKPGGKSGAEPRGKRLKSLRRMADLSRKALKERHGISASTIQAWEEAKSGGLTVKGAYRIVSALREEGVFCTVEWLLHGTGQAPYLTERVFLGAADPVATDTTPQPGLGSEIISKELITFRHLNANTIDMVIADDGMAPFYAPGDTVAGRRVYQEDIAKLAGKDCIVETQQGEILFRRLLSSLQPGRYHLQCINLAATVAEPFVYDVILISAAPVIWHRRTE